jgi:hypothetical protein
MYARVLFEGDRDLPLIVVALQEGSSLVSRLHGRGWPLCGGQVTEAPGVRIAITDSVFAIYVDGCCVLSEPTNPSAPDEYWWKVVQGLGSQAIAVIAEHGEIDLDAADITDRLDALVDRTTTAQAFLPVIQYLG